MTLAVHVISKLASICEYKRGLVEKFVDLEEAGLSRGFDAAAQASTPRPIVDFPLNTSQRQTASPRTASPALQQRNIDIRIVLKMASPEDTGVVRKPGPKPLQSSSPKTQYLILYNFVNAILWLTVLGRVVLLIPLVGFGRVYPGVGKFCKWTQTLALLEVVHAATGKLFSLLPTSIPRM